ncbi:MAG: hypothetical protein R3E04_13900 [Sphingobium sp.]
MADDGHVVNEAGALLAACCAGLVVMQVLFEMRNAEQSRQDLAQLSTESLTHLQRTRLESGLRRRESMRESRRLNLVLAIGILLASAELMHGFGHYLAPQHGALSASHTDDHDELVSDGDSQAGS